MAAMQHQQRLIASLCQPHLYDHPVDEITVMETHISWVLLCGDYAYKLKKAVDFGFLDYATLAKRKHQCDEELRLNRRTAASTYLEVIPIGGNFDSPILNTEPAIEYAVKMRRFPQQALLTQKISAGAFGQQEAIALADTLFAFHSSIDIAAPDSPFGTPESVYYPVKENFEQVREHITSPQLLKRLESLEHRSQQFFEHHRAAFVQRKQDGFIRDCHGDLHCNNILILDNQPQLFDCIEFNPSLRIIDVISELAFLIMDLEEHGLADLANLLLNRYLEHTGDYAGLRLMPFYLSYRAMVRAKVAVLRLAQRDISEDERETVMQAFNNYLTLAEAYAAKPQPQLFITHGLSGSGKTSLTQPLLSEPRLIRIRSDVERKRLFGFSADEASHSALGTNIYTAEATQQTYDRLKAETGAALEGGYRVIVDATFLRASERHAFRQMSAALKVPFTILNFQASARVLHQRVSERQQQGGDASEADNTVLQHQLDHYQRLTEDEVETTVTINSEEADSYRALQALLQRE